MARAARLSGEIDEEEQELEQLLQEKSENPASLVCCYYCVDVKVLLVACF